MIPYSQTVAHKIVRHAQPTAETIGGVRCSGG